MHPDRSDHVLPPLPPTVTKVRNATALRKDLISSATMLKKEVEVVMARFMEVVDLLIIRTSEIPENSKILTVCHRALLNRDKAQRIRRHDHTS